jgi:DNA-binding GntR family transcriptional regulator
MSDTTASPSLSREAYEIVRSRILRGELKLGQVISRRKLANELGMSFLPVSEALLRLEVEGLLESRPRAGTRVRIPTAEDVQGHFVVREALEMQAARLFAKSATAEERAELQKLAARVDTLSSQPKSDRSHYLGLHEKLHRKIAEYSRCKALSDAIEQTHALASTWMCIGRGSGHMARHHQTLIEALSSGDAAVASDAMREHVRSSLKNSLERLAPYFRLQQANGSTYARSAKKQRELEVENSAEKAASNWDFEAPPQVN